MESNQEDRILEQIKELPDVIRIEQIGEHHVIGCSKDITNELSRMVIESNTILTHLNRKQFGLDEIYHRYFEGGEAHASDRQAKKAVANS
jgi:ABC-2 type transport system ATP-binding protein